MINMMRKVVSTHVWKHIKFLHFAKRAIIANDLIDVGNQKYRNLRREQKASGTLPPWYRRALEWSARGMKNNAARLGMLYMGVGGTYDVFTGHVKRAPKIWQTLGLEWLYRLLSQPSRIKRQLRLLRYLRWHYTGNL